MYRYALFFQFYGWLGSGPVFCQKKRKTQVNVLKKYLRISANLFGRWSLQPLKFLFSVSVSPSNGVFKYFNFSIRSFIVYFFNGRVDRKPIWHQYLTNAPPFSKIPATVTRLHSIFRKEVIRGFLLLV